MTKDHKIASLNCLNDAEVFLLVTDKNVAVIGEHGAVVASLAAAIANNEEIRNIVADAAEIVAHEIRTT